jgi:hypothetical protein
MSAADTSFPSVSHGCIINIFLFVVASLILIRDNRMGALMKLSARQQCQRLSSQWYLIF